MILRYTNIMKIESKICFNRFFFNENLVELLLVISNEHIYLELICKRSYEQFCYKINIKPQRFALEIVKIK